jgi:hypothetical protein
VLPFAFPSEIVLLPFAASHPRRRASTLLASEHAVSIGALRRRDLFLQNIPMLCDLTIGHAENIDPDHRLRSPSDIAAVNHDIVAIGHHDTGLPKSSRSKKTLTIRSGKSDGMAANFASCRTPAAPTKTRWSCTY